MVPFNSRPHAEVDCLPKAAIDTSAFFQLTTSRRGRPGAVWEKLFGGYFQLTTSRRGRQPWTSSYELFNDFQLTTSRRGRLKQVLCEHGRVSFQLTTSRRGRHSASTRQDRFRPFNSRPHAEVDPEAPSSAWHSYLSTHDLTQRSTCFWQK